MIKKKIATPSDLQPSEQALNWNVRSLDSVARRMVDECDDRLSWIHKMKACIAEEERAALQQRRCCDDLLRLTTKHREGIDNLTAHYNRQLAEPAETLSDKENAVNDRMQAILLRAKEVGELFKVLDAKEREATTRGLDLTRREDAIDAEMREAQREAKDLKALEYDLEDRVRAVERRQEAISLWDQRLDRREQDIVKLERAHAVVPRPHRHAAAEAIDLDE